MKANAGGRVVAIATLAIAASDAAPLHAEGERMDRIASISCCVRTVKALRNGEDITASLGVNTVKYEADGTAWRKLTGGSVERGSWRFINKEQTQLEITTKAGKTRWLILELHGDVFRKANIDTGVEFIYSPVK
jgi:hypothetical protein